MKKRTVLLGKKAGFTLAELMIALVILTVVILSYVGANIQAHKNTEEMNERTVAIQNANQVIEQMRTISNTDPFPASVVTAYPDNGPVAGFNSLTNEQVTVTYQNPAANPLVCTVTVTWSSYTGRQSTETVETYITQRG